MSFEILSHAKSTQSLKGVSCQKGLAGAQLTVQKQI
jgi:hypothetical protein